MVVLIFGLSQQLRSQDSFERLPLVNLVIPEVRFENVPLVDAVLVLQEEANRNKKGGRPISIAVRPHPRRPNPLVNAHILGQSLDTLLSFITEQVGYKWRVERGQIVVFTDEGYLDRDELVQAIPGRLHLKAIRIPKIEFRDTPISEAMRMLTIEGRRNGLRAIEPGAGIWSIEMRVSFTWGAEPRVSGTFIDTDVDTIIEILTKQSGSTDWSTEKGKVIIIRRGQTPDQRRSAASVDPFAPADPFAAPAAPAGPSRPSAGYGRTTVSGPSVAPPSGGGEFQFNTESYDHLRDNPFLSPRNEPLSTFSIDVDTASYSNVRRFIMGEGRVPPVDAVRIEEMINYFDYNYPPPQEIEEPVNPSLPVEHPFASHVEVAATPWNAGHRLVKIGLKGYEVPLENRPESNLVFLLDVSGSMNAINKLDLVKRSMNLLLDGLTPRDRIAIVIYAGASGLVLESTPGNEKDSIRNAINRLNAGGSTNAGDGIELAYKVAEENLVPDGNNRVILCTDGDFNVGVTDRGSLKRMVAEKAKKGVQLTVLGFGMRNYKDDMLESLSNHGDGNYAYIDSFREAKKLFVQRLLGTLIMIAKDVKIQVEFNPRNVAAYRLIGYENRLLKNRDFDDDQVDAGDIGSGHTVTALYEVVPPGVELPEHPGDIDLRYQKTEVIEEDAAEAGELLTLKLRYKFPGAEESRLIVTRVKDEERRFEESSSDLQFSSAVAGFGMLLRQSPHCGGFSHDEVLDIAKDNLGKDEWGDRAEFLEMVKKFVW